MVAITYDPAYDLPLRLNAYAEIRGFKIDDQNRFFRAEGKINERLQQYFNLGVNYAGSIVNNHRIELFLLNKEGKIAQCFTHLQWNEAEVIKAVKELLKKSNVNINLPAITIKVSKNVINVVPPIVIAFFPKCPACWAAYLSVFGIASLKSIPYSPWLLPIFGIITGVNLYALFVGAKKRNGLVPFYISLLGAICLFILGNQLGVTIGSYLGVVFLFFGSSLNSLPFRTYFILKQRILRFLSFM
ncbi:hypothetical protein DC20_00350 [Rufibacter tibetensis]|uniref:Uncharacterized protein n=2 Tax=Rufibacter tibetensis TaxID=512763 RepID=A0A0P0CTX5_9BACT|nr:hypothetical protein DC20_00350 [Rufibacter tibetensis]